MKETRIRIQKHRFLRVKTMPGSHQGLRRVPLKLDPLCNGWGLSQGLPTGRKRTWIRRWYVEP